MELCDQDFESMILNLNIYCNRNLPILFYKVSDESKVDVTLTYSGEEVSLKNYQLWNHKTGLNISKEVIEFIMFHYHIINSQSCSLHDSISS